MLKQPAAPFERLEFHGDSVSLDTEGKVLVSLQDTLIYFQNIMNLHSPKGGHFLKLEHIHLQMILRLN